MPDINIKLIRVDPTLKTPAYQTPGSSGCDVHASSACVIAPGRRVLMLVGIKLEIPVGYECQIRPRSSLALKHGITVLNSPSTIDSDYRGELAVLLFNAGQDPFSVEKGDRIAQLVFAPVAKAYFQFVDELTPTQRNTGGFGSTGVK